MPSLYKRFFEVVPQNNISEFRATGGVNQINFLIPAVQGAVLSTQDLVLSGNLQVNIDAATPVQQTDFGPNGTGDGIGLDNVLGLHNIIDRVDVSSMRGNTLIEQRLNYQLISKYQRGVQAASNLENGKFNGQQLCSSEVRGARNFTARANLADDGQDFAIQLNTGIMKSNDQVLNLAAIGGLMVKVYLTEPINAFFNLNPGGGATQIGNAFTYTLKNIKLFGRYNYMTPDVISSLSGVSYRKTDNLMSVIQSSNDTLTNMPQVMALHKTIYVSQPNNETSNNENVNNMATNGTVGLKNYLLSMNGTRLPLDYSVENKPLIQELPTTSGQDQRVKGNAEQSYLSISALNDQFPPTHSLVNAANQAAALGDQFANVNDNCRNVDIIGQNYSFNFEGYTVAVPNDMLSINVESSVNNIETNLPAGGGGSRNIVGQSATQNMFIEYQSRLDYAGMTGSR